MSSFPPYLWFESSQHEQVLATLDVEDVGLERIAGGLDLSREDTEESGQPLHTTMTGIRASHPLYSLTPSKPVPI